MLNIQWEDILVYCFGIYIPIAYQVEMQFLIYKRAQEFLFSKQFTFTVLFYYKPRDIPEIFKTGTV